jgi:hypothetical protein
VTVIAKLEKSYVYEGSHKEFYTCCIIYLAIYV